MHMISESIVVHECDTDTVDRILPLMRAFHAESGHTVVADFDADIWLDAMRSLYQQGLARITYTTHDGREDSQPAAFMAAYISCNLFNGDIQVQEQAWYVQAAARTDPHGWVLMRELEAWSRSIGAKRILVTHLNNTTGDRLRAILPRFGYQPLELYYAKELD